MDSDNVVAVAKPVSTPTVSPDGSEKTSPEEGNKYATKDSIAMPLEIYERERHQDYGIEALELNEDPEILPWALQEKTKAISKYVRERMDKEGYEPTTEAYDTMLSRIKREVKADKFTSQEVVIDRLMGYIEASDLLRSVKSINEEALLKEVRGAKTKDAMMQIVMKELEKYID